MIILNSRKVLILLAVCLFVISTSSCNTDKIISPPLTFKWIFGNDDRQDYYEIDDPFIRHCIEKSSVAVRIDYDHILNNKDICTTYSQTYMSTKLSRNRLEICTGDIPLCPSIEDQLAVSACSGTLIGDDLILTAGHCVDWWNHDHVIDEWDAPGYIQFGYYLVDSNKMFGHNDCQPPDVPEEKAYLFPEIDVGPGIKRFYYDVPSDVIAFRWEGTVDYAIIKLRDRPTDYGFEPAPVIPNHLVFQGEQVLAIGTPNGRPLKAKFGPVKNGRVFSQDYFEAWLDLFHGDSGGGVYDWYDMPGGTRQYFIVGLVQGGVGEAAHFYVDDNNGCCAESVLEEQPDNIYTNIVYVKNAIDDLCSHEEYQHYAVCSRQCDSGVCCDVESGTFKDSNTLCYELHETGCFNGTGCGSDVIVRTTRYYCSGNSYTCDGRQEQFLSIEEYCGNNEKCTRNQDGSYSCNTSGNCNCVCSIGDCCDGCSYEPSGTLCRENVDREYYCVGNGCGSDVYVRHKNLVCSGNSSICDEEHAISVWGEGQLLHDCKSDEECRPRNNQCFNEPSCTLQPPELRGGEISIPDGYITTIFHFEVDYRDLNGDTPTQKDLIIVLQNGGEVRKEMSPQSTNYSNWTTFVADVPGTEMGIGHHKLYFLFGNADGTDRRPDSGFFDGPIVNDVEPAIRFVQPNDEPLFVSPGDVAHLEWTSIGCVSIGRLAYGTNRVIPPQQNNYGTVIATDLPANGSYNWTTGGIPEGSYWILAECYNSTGQWDWEYSPKQVVISQNYQSDRAWYPVEIIGTGNYPDITVSSDGTAHVVWRGAQGIEYSRRNTDGTWSPPMLVGSVTAPYYVDTGPFIAVASDGSSHISFATLVGSPATTQLHYLRVDGDGAIGIADRIVESYNDYGFCFGITADDNDGIHIGYVKYEIPSTLFHYKSIDGGQTFGTPNIVNASTTGIYDYEFGNSISASGNNVHIAAQYSQSGDRYIHYFRSNDGGNTWTGPTVFGDGTYEPRIPSVSSCESRVMMAYIERGPNEYYRLSFANGASWSQEMAFTTPASTRKKIVCKNGKGYWAGAEGSVLHFVESLSDATTWSVDAVISNEFNLPRMDVDENENVHIVGRDGSGNIIYLLSRPPQACPEIRITDIRNILCYPSCLLKWDTHDDDGDPVAVRIAYDTDTDASSMTTVAGAESISDRSWFVWDTENMPSGNYYIYLEADDGICQKGVYSSVPLIVNRQPQISVMDPPAEGARAYGDYAIHWSADDMDNINLNVSLYWQDANRPSDFGLIAENLEKSGEHVWNVSSFENGKTLKVVGVVCEGVNPCVQEESPGVLIVQHPNTECAIDSDCQQPNTCVGGFCSCFPMCEGIECGPDPVCGINCGGCGEGESCIEGECVSCGCDDGDGDGHYLESCGDASCNPRDDCDDTDAAVHPGAEEVCNGKDDDCNGSADDGIDCGSCGCQDGDGDGHYPLDCSDPNCNPTDDCNDENESTFPGAPEHCNGVDDNCDGNTDEGNTCASCDCDDRDGDGHFPTSCENKSCSPRDDCDDLDPMVRPGPHGDGCLKPGIDDDCDGETDEDCGVCGDGYCNAERDEDENTCPEDCRKKEKAKTGIPRGCGCSTNEDAGLGMIFIGIMWFFIRKKKRIE